ncbi:MAG: hypothetical protein QM769_07570 [Pseudoxanthomonas sp.]
MNTPWSQSPSNRSETPMQRGKAGRGTVHIHLASRNLAMASVRYRGLLPGCALRALGWRVEIGSGDTLPAVDTALALAVKPLSDKDARWVQRVARNDTPVVVDLCDNVFIEGYGGQGTVIGDRLASLCPELAAMTVPTVALRDVVIAHTGLSPQRVLVVPDIVETPALLERQKELLGERGGLMQRLRQAWPRPSAVPAAAGPVLLWFGNHGASYANFGLQDLLLFADALAEAGKRAGAELWVVSNHRDKFEQVAAQLPITCRYFEWAPEIVDTLLPLADACLAPSSLDAFSRTKSANRALKALGRQVPVIATPTDAYADLAGAVWLGDAREGVKTYLDDPATRRRHLDAARRIIAERYSFPSLQRTMAGVVAAVQREHA